MSQPAIFQPASTLDWLRTHTRVFAFEQASSARQQDGWRTFSLFFLVVILSFILFAARQPSQLLSPDLVAEDGAVFFADAYNQGALATFLKLHGGYFNLIPRLIAPFGLLFPYSVTPIVYSFSALVITGIAASWFVLPHYQHVVANDLLRVAFTALILLSSNVEAPMLIAYVQWHIALWCMLFAFMRFPARAITQWILALCYLLAILSAPVLIVLLPIWIVRLIHAKEPERLWIASILIVQSVVALGTVARVANDPQAVSSDQLVLDYVRAVSYKIGGLALFGQKLTLQTFQLLGWSALYLAIIIIMLAILVIWWRNRSSDRAVIGALLIFIIVVSSLLYLPRASSFGLPFAHDRVGVFTHSPRYFLLSTAALYLLLLMYADLWITQARSRTRYAAVIASTCLILLCNSLSFTIRPWDNASWPSYARILSAIDRNGAPQGEHILARLARVISGSDRASTTSPVQIAIPNTPKGWCIGLSVPSDPLTMANFLNDLTLITIDPALTDMGTVAVDLVWKGNTAVPQNPNEHVTAFVHLIDANHNRLAGNDILLVPDTSPTCADEIFESHHVITVPDGIAPGVYGLAIGVYYFQQDEIVPVGSITLDNALTIP